MQDIHLTIDSVFQLLMTQMVAQAGMSGTQSHLHILVVSHCYLTTFIGIVKRRRLQRDYPFDFLLQSCFVESVRYEFRNRLVVRELTWDKYAAHRVVSGVLEADLVCEEHTIVLISEPLSQHLF